MRVRASASADRVRPFVSNRVRMKRSTGVRAKLAPFGAGRAGLTTGRKAQWRLRASATAEMVGATPPSGQGAPILIQAARDSTVRGGSFSLGGMFRIFG